MENTFLKKRHTDYQTSEQTLFDCVWHATGEVVTQAHPLHAGYDNEVYCVEGGVQKAYVVRIARYGDTSLLQEAWALEQARNAGVCVPDVFWTGTYDFEGTLREVMVQSRMEGTPLPHFKDDVTSVVWQKLCENVIENLEKLHSVRVGGYYKRQIDGSWDFPDWEAITASALQDRAKDLEALTERGFLVEAAARVWAIVERSLIQERPSSAVLCHGDLHSEHIFVNAGGSLSGFIDFGEFQGGVPIIDYAAFYSALPEEVRYLLVKSHSALGASFEEQVLLYKVCYDVGLLAHFVRLGDLQSAEQTEKEMRDCLRQWEERQ